MSLRCYMARRLLSARAAGLSEHDKLRLEQHVVDCDACATDATLLTAMRELVLDDLPSPPERSRRRAIERALDAGLATQRTSSPPMRNRPMARRIAVGSVAVAAAAGLVLWIGAGPGNDGSGGGESVGAGDPARANVTAGTDTEVGHVRAGDVTAASHLHGVGDLLPDDEAWHTTDGAEIELARADVELAPGTTVRWTSDRSTLSLVDGTVDVHVEPGSRTADRPLSVVTASFRAVVLGTRFEVTTSSVTVHVGVVRVFDPDGNELATLQAGGRWSIADHPSAASEPTTDVDISATLALARRQVAAGQVAGANRSIAAVLSASPSPRQAAEAHTLRAESSLVAGDRADAARRYRFVSQRYPASRAGENALFAAARLQDELGRSAEARALFESYLTRYPEGRFHREALHRLGRD